MSDTVSKRKEILFFYDIENANPNGDPLDENKPRVDYESSINDVTDVRLKRTIRDYLYEYKGFNGENEKDIFVREIKDKEGKIQDGKTRAKDFNESSEDILKKCIDIRLFGGVIPLEGSSITYTGPVQFRMGKSMHKVEVRQIKGTGAFASKAGNEQKTFRVEYILPYSFICFYGIINENAAKTTLLTDEDVDLLNEAIWNGTKNLISRSKFGQMPRLLIEVTYKDPGYFIGDLDKYIKLDTELSDEKIRSIEDFKLDISEFIKKIEENKEKIEKVEYIAYDKLKFDDESKKHIENNFEKINI